VSHHSSDEENPKESGKIMEELTRRLKESFGEFPHGRLNAQDEGAIPLGISHQNGKVVMQFARNLNWIGFTPEQAIEIAEILIQHARQCGCDKPLTVKIG